MIISAAGKRLPVVQDIEIKTNTFSGVKEFQWYNGYISFYEESDNEEELYTKYHSFYFNFKSTSFEEAEIEFEGFCKRRFKKIHSTTQCVYIGKKEPLANFTRKTWSFSTTSKFKLVN